MGGEGAHRICSAGNAVGLPQAGGMAPDRLLYQKSAQNRAGQRPGVAQLSGSSPSSRFCCRCSSCMPCA